MGTDEPLSKTADELIAFFDHCGHLGVSELVRCLASQEYGATVDSFKVSGICAEFRGNMAQGEFIYQRDTKVPLKQLVEIARNFEYFTFEETQIFNAVCLEIACALNGNGNGKRELFATIELSFSGT